MKNARPALYWAMVVYMILFSTAMLVAHQSIR